jgi:hypothetical protein
LARCKYLQRAFVWEDARCKYLQRAFIWSASRAVRWIFFFLLEKPVETAHFGESGGRRVLDWR